MSNQLAHANQELVALFQEDQNDRRFAGLHEGYAERDRVRRDRVTQLEAEGGFSCSDDYVMAALIFQHGESPDDYLRAHRLMLKAIDLGETEIKWLAAAALDRYLVRQGLPVKYGTQNIRMGGIYRVPPMDPTTTDLERAAWGIPSRDEILAQRHSPGRPPVKELGSLTVADLRVTVHSLPRPLTWHAEMLPDRQATDLTAPSGRPIWVNVQGWHWSEQETGELELGWTQIPYAPELGHMVAQAEQAELVEGSVSGRPSIWVRTDAKLWTLYATASTGEAVWAVTGIGRDDVFCQMERLLSTT